MRNCCAPSLCPQLLSFLCPLHSTLTFALFLVLLTALIQPSLLRVSAKSGLCAFCPSVLCTASISTLIVWHARTPTFHPLSWGLQVNFISRVASVPDSCFPCPRAPQHSFCGALSSADSEFLWTLLMASVGLWAPRTVLMASVGLWVTVPPCHCYFPLFSQTRSFSLKAKGKWCLIGAAGPICLGCL